MAKSIPITASCGALRLCSYLSLNSFNPSQDVSASSFETFGWFTGSLSLNQHGMSEIWFNSQLQPLSRKRVPYHQSGCEYLNYKTVDRFKYDDDLEYNRSE